MKHSNRTFALLVIATWLLIGPSALAADVFVRQTRGSDLSPDQKDQITEMVRNSIRKMPEHSLVQSENQADFTIEPSIVQDGEQKFLRIEKRKSGDLLAQAQEPITLDSVASDSAMAATEAAMQGDLIATGGYDDTAASSSSGTSQSPSVDLAHGGDVRAPSPFVASSDRWGAFQAGIGPAFGAGMGSDQLLYDINLGYAVPINDTVSGKAFGDLNLATGADANRFINLGLGAEVFPLQSQAVMGTARPYLTGDLGYAFTRDKQEVTKDAPAVGAGAGFKFAAQQLNMDVNLHYSILTAKIQNDYPSVLGLRAALNF